MVQSTTLFVAVQVVLLMVVIVVLVRNIKGIQLVLASFSFLDNVGYYYCTPDVLVVNYIRTTIEYQRAVLVVVAAVLVDGADYFGGGGGRCYYYYSY